MDNRRVRSLNGRVRFTLRSNRGVGNKSEQSTLDHGEPPRVLDDTSDEELMALVARGRREALAVLVRRHQQNTLALAYRILGRWDAAEDVCQDAFIRVFRSAERYEPTARFTTWLYRIVMNLCLDRRRRVVRDGVSLPPEQSIEPAGATDAPLERQEIRERVRMAIAQLPERQRVALILHRYEGMSHKEITSITGWSASAVESCLVRAYGRLRDLLADLERDQ